MTATDLSSIDQTIEIKASPERVWRALTSAPELSAWFEMIIEGEIAPGKEVWMTTTNPEYPGQRFRVRFVEMTPPRRFVWQWHPGQLDPNVDYSREPRTTSRSRSSQPRAERGYGLSRPVSIRSR